jgi:hypothetical protein
MTRNTVHLPLCPLHPSAENSQLLHRYIIKQHASMKVSHTCRVYIFYCTVGSYLPNI